MTKIETTCLNKTPRPRVSCAGRRMIGESEASHDSFGINLKNWSNVSLLIFIKKILANKMNFKMRMRKWGDFREVPPIYSFISTIVCLFWQLHVYFAKIDKFDANWANLRQIALICVKFGQFASNCLNLDPEAKKVDPEQLMWIQSPEQWIQSNHWIQNTHWIQNKQLGSRAKTGSRARLGSKTKTGSRARHFGSRRDNS